MADVDMRSGCACCMGRHRKAPFLHCMCNRSCWQRLFRVLQVVPAVLSASRLLSSEPGISQLLNYHAPSGGYWVSLAMMRRGLGPPIRPLRNKLTACALPGSPKRQLAIEMPCITPADLLLPEP